MSETARIRVARPLAMLKELSADNSLADPVVHGGADRSVPCGRVSGQGRDVRIGVGWTSRAQGTVAGLAG